MGYKKILHPGIRSLNVSKLPLNSSLGLLAQMVERFAGSEEVAGSNPVQSTTLSCYAIYQVQVYCARQVHTLVYVML